MSQANAKSAPGLRRCSCGADVSSPSGTQYSTSWPRRLSIETSGRHEHLNRVQTFARTDPWRGKLAATSARASPIRHGDTSRRELDDCQSVDSAATSDFVAIATILKIIGVADGTRTRDNRHHKPGLYQLSYSHHRYKRLVAACSSNRYYQGSPQPGTWRQRFATQSRASQALLSGWVPASLAYAQPSSCSSCSSSPK